MTDEEQSYKGVGVSPGFAVGKPVVIEKDEAKISRKKLAPSEVDAEVRRFKEVLSKCRKQLQQLCKQLGGEKSNESRAILESQIQLLEDHSFLGWVQQEIVHGHRRAESAFFHTMKAFEARFSRLDPFFQERFKDFQLLTGRIMELLQNRQSSFAAEYPKGAVVFTNELSAFDVAEGIRRKVAAFVTSKGGATSHASIMARAQKIPVVTSVEFFKCSSLLDLPKVAVDGTSGKISAYNPSADAKRSLKELSSAGIDLQSKTFTSDGMPISLSVNVESSSQAREVYALTQARIGLFRSEFAFIGYKQFPAESVQYKKYCSLVEAMEGREVVIRTFDIGGDKCFFQEAGPSKNRSLKFFLKEKRLFIKQVRAILRASISGPVRILLPMVTCVDDLLCAKKMIANEVASLKNEGHAALRMPPLGVMIETPSAALISDLLAQEADFFSIGTNDLIQYCLAVDRQEHVVQHIHAPSHPSIIRLLSLIVKNAAKYKIPVSVCGEMAADPRFTALLIGLGVADLSVTMTAYPAIKATIHALSLKKSKELTKKVLTLTNTDAILEELTC